MRQHMRDHRQIVGLRIGRQNLFERLALFKHRWAVQPRPNPCLRSALQPQAPCRVALQQQPPRMRTALDLARAHRVLRRVALFVCGAHRLQRAQHAGGRLRRADAGAQIHHALRVARHVGGQIVDRQQLIGQRPELALVAGDGEVFAKPQHARQHAAHVRIQNGRALPKAERGNRAGGGSTDARQGRQQLDGVREFATELAHHLLRAAMQIACAAVVAQAAPERQHIVLRGCGQRAYIGKACEKARVVIQYGGDLRLLQHDLRKPHAICVPCVLPGQMIAAMLFLPTHNLRGNFGNPNCHQKSIN